MKLLAIVALVLMSLAAYICKQKIEGAIFQAAAWILIGFLDPHNK
jgi:hypothetical protein